MKISEVRPCDNCSKPLAEAGTFYVIDFSHAIVSRAAYRELIGLAMMLGDSVTLAEVMSPNPEIITVFGDAEPSLRTRLLICNTCFITGTIDLAAAAERLADRIKEKANE